MNILITGSKGFIGQNLHLKLKESNFHILTFDEGESLSDLKDRLLKSDILFHLAGTNRSLNDDDFFKGNVDLTEFITAFLIQENHHIPIIFSSSIHANTDSIYGKTKRVAEELLLKYQKESKSNVYIYRLPNVFGKWAKPFYNSVVATFCHQISRNEAITIHDPKKVMPLIYIDDVILLLIKSMNGQTSTGVIEVDTYHEITLENLAKKLRQFHEIRETHIIPVYEDAFDKKLHATFLSYYDINDFSYTTKKHSDQRGFLSELIKHPSFGQIFISKTKPGITRGNHYHHTKIEKFMVISGTAKISFRHILNDEIKDYVVCGDDMIILDIIPGYTHSITNIGKDELITLFWSNEIYDPNNDDTKFMEVIKS